MLKIRRRILMIWISILSIGFLCIYFFFVEDEDNIESTSTMLQIETPFEEVIEGNEDGSEQVSKNKYYIIYLEQDNSYGQPDSSFIPLTLNPGYEPFKDGTYVSISFDDYGTIVNDGKIIVIKNYNISDSNKEQIRELAGESKYLEALREIEERIKSTKESLN